MYGSTKPAASTRRGGTARHPRILVVEHGADTAAGLLGARLSECGVQLDVRRPYAGDPLPPDLAETDGLLVLGGHMGPYDDADAPWLPGTRQLLRYAVADDLPTMAVCLGMELLTVACGGTVRQAATPEFGLVPLRAAAQCADDPLFGPLADAADGSVEGVVAATFHHEEIAEPPADAVRLLESDDCTWQAFRLGSQVWGVQFHPEVIGRQVRGWAEREPTVPEVSGQSADAVAAAVEAVDKRLPELWEPLAERWAARL